MKKAIFFFAIATLLFGDMLLQAQDITGTWEGRLDGRQFLQLNIVQVGKVVCGYSWDHDNINAKSYCMARFMGRLDEVENEWVLTGYSFIEQSGDHDLMTLRIYLKTGPNGKKTIEGWSAYPGGYISFLSRRLGPQILLNKVSDAPSEIFDFMKDCKKQKEDKKDNPAPIIQKNDTITKPVSPERPPVKKDSIGIVKEMQSRKNTALKPLLVNDRNIILKLYDNATVDGDSISIFYNGKLLLSHKKLTEQAIEIPLVLDEQADRHEITLFAENLGSIPPNTALVVITAGKKRYELFASASLSENAVIVLEYKPG